VSFGSFFYYVLRVIFFRAAWNAIAD